MSRTSETREHLFALYRSGTATPDQLVAAKQAYDQAAKDEGIQAIVDSIGPGDAELTRRLVAILAPVWR